jgi:hypothetical protein
MKNKLIESEEWKVFHTLNKENAFTQEVDQGFGKGVKIKQIPVENINRLPKQSTYFYGNTGVGKTLILNHWKIIGQIKGFKVCHIEESEIFDDPFNFVLDLINETKGHTIFCIDDVFKEVNWSTLTDKNGKIINEKYRQLYRFYDYLYKRHHEGCLILMNSNYKLDNFLSILERKFDSDKTLTRRIREITAYRLREKQAEDVYGTEPNV